MFYAAYARWTPDGFHSPGFRFRRGRGNKSVYRKDAKKEERRVYRRDAEARREKEERSVYRKDAETQRENLGLSASAVKKREITLRLSASAVKILLSTTQGPPGKWHTVSLRAFSVCSVFKRT